MPDASEFPTRQLDLHEVPELNATGEKARANGAPARPQETSGPLFIPAPVRRRVVKPADPVSEPAGFQPMPVRRPAAPQPAPSPLAGQRPAPQAEIPPAPSPVARREPTPRAELPPAPRPAPAREPERRQETPAEAGTDGVLLQAVSLRREVAKGKVILHDVSLIARPREFVAIVGGSGAGKSTLLGALAGFRPATSGQVLLDGVSLYDHAEALRSHIGFVPQDDVIHRELTVERALGYAAELRLPADWTPAQRAARVDEVLAELGLQEHRGTIVSSLSGGQRKRVSIGVELLTRPGLFFLDEPTSGLDPGTETRMMHLLRQLADQGRTILLITHATRNLAMCDKVLFLARGGRIAYYGSPQDALRYFNVKEIEEIYDLLEQGNAEATEAAYRNSPLYRSEIEAPLAQAGPLRQPPARQTSQAQERQESLRQFKILTRRYADIVIHDRKNLIILLAQAPIIAVLLWALFSSSAFQQPKDEWLFAPRFARQPVLLSEPVGAQNCASLGLSSSCTFEDAAPKILAQARRQNRTSGNAQTQLSGQTELIFYKGADCSTLQLGPNCAQDPTAGNTNAGKAAQLIFILAATAVWLGTLNAIREISKEDAIYRRERLVNLRVLPYLGSKFVVLLALVLVQCTLLFAVAAMHVGFPAGGAFGIWLSLVLGASAAVALALAVSSAVSNPDRAVFAAPLIMLPQILLAGLLVPVSGLGIAQPLAALVTSRWAYEAAGRAAGVMNTAAFAPGFQYRTALDGSVFIPWLALLALVAGSAAAAFVMQKRKDHNN